jgi:hypothetical protein
MIAQACGGAIIIADRQTKRLLGLVLVQLLLLLVLLLLLLVLVLLLLVLDAAVEIHGNVVVLLVPSRIMDMHRLYNE